MPLQDKRAFQEHIRVVRGLHKRDDRDFAEEAVNSTLAILLSARYPRLATLGLRPPMPLAKKPAVKSFAGWLQDLGFLDCAYWLSSAYAWLLPSDQRETQAVFFTPPLLSSRLIRSLRSHGVRFNAARFVDPSSGGSAFLAPLAMRIAQELAVAGRHSPSIISHIEQHIAGFELDPFLCQLSRVFLNMAVYAHVCKARRPLNPNIFKGDSLAVALPYAGQYEVVVSNPPYRKIGAEEYARLHETYRHLVLGQVNLYSLFIELSLRLCVAGGHIGLITPAGFFGGRSFGPLRAVLSRETTIKQVDFIEPRTGNFLDVEQETALTVLHKEVTSDPRTLVYGTDDARSFVSLGSFLPPAEPTSSWVLPRRPEGVEATKAFTPSSWSLAHYGYEPKTGYLVPHKTRLRLLKTKGRKRSVRPLIWATQIGKDGIHNFKAGDGNHAKIYVDCKKATSGVLTVPSVALQRTSSKDQSPRLRCAPITQAFIDKHRGYMGENHVCLIVPIAGRPQLVSVELLAMILSTTPVDQAFQCLSGTATVSAYELKALPLPNPATVRQAVNAGATLTEAVRLGYTDSTPIEIKNKKAA